VDYEVQDMSLKAHKETQTSSVDVVGIRPIGRGKIHVLTRGIGDESIYWE
jgi:hypothetical protein